LCLLCFVREGYKNADYPLGCYKTYSIRFEPVAKVHNGRGNPRSSTYNFHALFSQNMWEFNIKVLSFWTIMSSRVKDNWRFNKNSSKYFLPFWWKNVNMKLIERKTNWQKKRFCSKWKQNSKINRKMTLFVFTKNRFWVLLFLEQFH